MTPNSQNVISNTPSKLEGVAAARRTGACVNCPQATHSSVRLAAATSPSLGEELGVSGHITLGE